MKKINKNVNDDYVNVDELLVMTWRWQPPCSRKDVLIQESLTELLSDMEEVWVKQGS